MCTTSPNRAPAASSPQAAAAAANQAALAAAMNQRVADYQQRIRSGAVVPQPMVATSVPPAPVTPGAVPPPPGWMSAALPGTIPHDELARYPPMPGAMSPAAPVGMAGPPAPRWAPGARVFPNVRPSPVPVLGGVGYGGVDWGRNQTVESGPPPPPSPTTTYGAQLYGPRASRYTI